MKGSRWFYHWAVTVFVVFLIAMPASGQQAAELVGTVMDPSGAVVPGATVTATNEATGAVREVQSNVEGSYRVAPLPAGSYTIEVSADAFNTQVQSGLVLQVNQVARTDFTLQLGQVGTVIEVEATTPVVASENATVGQVIDNKKIIELPMNGREFLDLARLTPGVAQRRGVACGETCGVFINGGGSQSGSLMQIDGVDNFEAAFGRPNIVPSMDMIQEFKIQTAQFDASQGRAGIGQINTISKSGTNTFHGSLYEFNRVAKLAALNTFDQSTEQRVAAGLSPRPPYIRNQFGASLGGPIKKNQTFFFFNFEGKRIREVARGVLTVPDNFLRDGDFSQRSRIIHDPTTLNRNTNSRMPFPNNMIPASRIDPVSINYLGFTPLPNGPGQTNNYTATPSASTDVNQYTFKGDHRWNPNSITSGRYTWNERNGIVPGFLGSVMFPGFHEVQNFPAQNANITHTEIINPTMVYELLLGYNRFFQNRYHGHQGEDIGAQLGLAEQSGLPEGQRTGGFPALGVSGFAMPHEHAFAPLFQSDDSYQIFNKISKELTNHSLKAGIEFTYKTSPLHFHANDRGTYQFRPRYSTELVSGPGGPDNAFAEFLLGDITATNRAFGFPDNITKSNWWSVYLHDDWRVRPNFTLNLGVRWERYSGVYERFDRFNTFCFDIEQFCPVVATPGVPRAGFDPDNNNFMPRVGFAWRVFGDNKTVVRGGYGIFYDYRIANSFFNMNQSPPWQFQDPRSSDPDVPTLTFQNPFPGPIPATPTAADATTGTAVARDLRGGYVHQWSLGLQRQLFTDTVLDVAYVANRGIATVHGWNPNFVGAGLGPTQARRRFPHLQGISYVSNVGQSWYDSLQVRMERRFTGGFNFVGAYTWGKSNAIGCVVGSQNECQGFRNPTNFRLDKGPGPADIRHRLVVSSVFELPFGRGKRFGGDAPRGLDMVIGGWQISAIATFQTGNRVTPSLTYNNSNAGGNRPDQIGDPMANAARTLDNWFDHTAFVRPPTLQQVLDSGQDVWRSIGNAGRGSIVGPGLNLWDLGIMKRFPLPWEGHSVQWRTELFNAWNHPNFGNPNTSLPYIPGRTGTIRSTSVPNRTVQLGLRYDF